MRTTLVISDPVYRRAKRTAKEQGVRLSALITEATEEFLRRESAGKGKAMNKIAIESYSMGQPKADIDNRDELYRALEE
jgi:hypothetical protein